MRDAEVDEDGKLDDCNQDERQADALFHQCDDDEDCENRYRIDNLEVVIGCLDHVLHAGGFADEHTARVMLFQNGIQAVDLVVDLIACDLVFRIDEKQFPAVTLEDTADAVGQNLFRNSRAEHRFQTEDVFHAVHLLHFVDHGAHGFAGQLGVHQYHMRGGDVKVFRKLGIGDDVFHILRQALPHIVVHLVVGLVITVKRGGDEKQEYRKEDGEATGQEIRNALHVRDNRTVAGMLQRFVEYQNQRRQDGYATDDAEHNALCHDDSEVTSECEAHEAERDKARNGGNRTAEDARQRFVNRVRHGVAFIGVTGALFVVAVPEEDGVIHRYGKLKDGGKRFCNVRNFAEEVVCSEVDENHRADGGEEDERDEEAVEEEKHRDKRKRDRDADVNRLFLFAKILQVGNQCRHTRNEALFARNRADLADGVHGDVRRGCAVEKDRNHGGVSRVEGFIDFVRQQLHGNRDIREGVIPEDGFHVVNLFDFLGQPGNVFGGHILYNNEGKRAFAEFLQQGVLSFDRVHIGGQIIQHIVIDAGIDHAEHAGDQQKNSEDQNGYAASDNRFGKMHGELLLFFFKFCFVAVGFLVSDNPDCAQGGAEIQHAVGEQRDAEQDCHNADTFGGAEDQNCAEHSRNGCNGEDQPPPLESEAARVNGDLNLQEAVRKNQDAKDGTEDAQHSVGGDQQNASEQEHEQSRRKVVLKRETEQVVGEVSDELHRSEYGHDTAERNPKRLGRDFRHGDQKNAERAEQDGDGDIAEFCDSHWCYGSHEVNLLSFLFFFFRAPL